MGDRGRRRGLRTVVAAAVAALVCAGAGSAADFGANDDTGKFATDAGAGFYAEMAALGLRQAVVTVRWQPSDPLALAERPLLDLTVAAARAAGLEVVLATYPVPTARDRSRARTTRRIRRVARRARAQAPRGAAVRRRQRAEPGCVLAPAVHRAAAGFGPGVRAVPRSGLRRAEGGRRDDQRGRRGPLSARKRQAACEEQRVDLACPVPGRPRRLVPIERRDRPLMDGFSFHPYPNRATDPWSAATRGRTRDS